MKTAREIIAAAICMNRFGFEIIEGERDEADAILAALAAEGLSIVETGRDPATIEACAKVAEKMLRFADTTSGSDEAISSAIRALSRSTREAP